MPPSRLDDIYAAACRVIARGGIGALRVSDVAREAGVSTALIHYYVDTRADLLDRVFAYAEEQAEARTQSELAGLRSGADRLEAVLRLYVGDEAVFRENWVVWLEMWRNAVFDEAKRPAIVASYRAWVDQLAGMIRDGQADGSLAADADADAAAARLAALLDGLGQQVLLDAVSRRHAVRLLADAVRAELGLVLPDPSLT